ncbi:hypothetical protein EV283_1030 [Sphingomonas sp. BK036]|uniref:hypothetical protein n=1 Tax=Sphingomonas sp. BK036 TaxID=2512122 RepID=UPI00102948C3|nr:hypothetical protein [Sphingomonas sp. BK036]RZT56973.1 hypothetical protein EV283_1030 [Sphingomonas sp. BK036]
MIDYLQSLLAGRENGITVTLRLRAENAGTFSTTLLAVDEIGIVALRGNATSAYPWSAVRKIDIKDEDR